MQIDRRRAMQLLAAAVAGAGAGGARLLADEPAALATPEAGPVLFVDRLAFPWQTRDPFLFCVHHDDRFPAGNAQLGPAASLDGRRLGEDFAWKDGWNMYHGRVVPGFPQHPHRGFETITIVREGLVDHSDSLGATGRYGNGDVQWMTAGRGILHAEMFPLLRADEANPLDLFQIWLNLPAASKMSAPHYEMLWAEDVARRVEKDGQGHATEVTVIAGAIGKTRSPAPPPKSWASQEGSDVAIWTIEMEPGASWTLPTGPEGAHRTLYFHRGSTLTVADQELPSRSLAALEPTAAVSLRAGEDGASLLLLQGQEIGEPVARQGPFVMNTEEEIRQAWRDYQATEFGGWPWKDEAPVHAREQGRFAKHADGRTEKREG